MNLIEAFLLGLIQGLTEFLPVSSSGHLVIAQGLWSQSEQHILFNIIVHLGTLTAVLIFVRRELAALARVFFSGAWLHPARAWQEEPSFRLLIMIALACIPTAFLGFVLNDWFKALFNSPRAAGTALLVTGFILMATRSRICQEACLEEPTPAKAALLGLAQGLAIVPGISRSGTTIAVGLFLGLERNVAAKFSFLMFIPAVLGALVLELGEKSCLPLSPGPALIGFLAAGVSGYLALVLLVRLLAHGKFYLFAPYCWAIGLTAVFLG